MDVTGKAQTVLAEAHEAAKLLRREVEQEQAGLYAETRQVREFRDGLLEELGRVHGDISALLERTGKHKAKEPAAAGGTATPEVHPAPDIIEEASEPAGAGDEAGEPRPMQAPTGRRGQQDAARSSATERHPGHLSTSARQKLAAPDRQNSPLDERHKRRPAKSWTARKSHTPLSGRAARPPGQVEVTESGRTCQQRLHSPFNFPPS